MHSTAAFDKGTNRLPDLLSSKATFLRYPPNLSRLVRGGALFFIFAATMSIMRAEHTGKLPDKELPLTAVKPTESNFFFLPFQAQKHKHACDEGTVLLYPCSSRQKNLQPAPLPLARADYTPRSEGKA